MGWGEVLGFLFLLLVVGLLGFYWFFPYGEVNFLQHRYNNTNFTTGDDTKGMQFYDNMRYPSPDISYRIDDCPLKKRNDAENALKIISNLTVLNFHPVQSDEEISITCDSRKEMEGELIVAGEGGPSNITKTSNFNVIFGGQVLLLRESDCENPNVAIHELFHALGFDHSKNPGNIMYPVSNCNQEIGDDIPNTIDRLYSYPSYSDLSFENASAMMHGKYLDVNFTVRNNGLRDSQSFSIFVYADDKQVKEVEADSLKIGYGTSIMLGNILVLKLSTNEIRFEIKTSENEFDKNNNEIKLEVK